MFIYKNMLAIRTTESSDLSVAQRCSRVIGNNSLFTLAEVIF